MKILAFNPSLTVEQIAETLKNEGIAKSRLEEASGASFLPKIGKFETFGVDGNDEQKEGETVTVASTKHVRIGTKDMLDSISLSRLQINLFMGKEATEKDLALSAKGNYYLPGNTIVNPALQGNQANVIKKLIGKWFVATPVDGIGTNFKREGFKSVDEIKFRPVKAFKVETFATETEAKNYLTLQETASKESED